MHGSRIQEHGSVEPDGTTAVESSSSQRQVRPYEPIPVSNFLRALTTFWMRRGSNEEDPVSGIRETSNHGSSMQEIGSAFVLSERQSQEEEGEPRNQNDEAPNDIETAMSTRVCVRE
jgi:hypothetical protein